MACRSHIFEVPTVAETVFCYRGVRSRNKKWPMENGEGTVQPEPGGGSEALKAVRLSIIGRFKRLYKRRAWCL